MPKIKKIKKVVLCHGVFDLLHYGHILHFEEAKQQGDILVVSITSSNNVNKGPGRPYFNDLTRLKFLESLSIIDYVIVNHDITPIDLIKKLNQRFIAKAQITKKFR